MNSFCRKKGKRKAGTISFVLAKHELEALHLSIFSYLYENNKHAQEVLIWIEQNYLLVRDSPIFQLIGQASESRERLPAEFGAPAWDVRTLIFKHLTLECIPYVQNTVYIAFVHDWDLGNFSKSDPKFQQAAWKRENPNFLFNVCDSSESLRLSLITVPALGHQPLKKNHSYISKQNPRILRLNPV